MANQDNQNRFDRAANYRAAVRANQPAGDWVTVQQFRPALITLSRSGQWYANLVSLAADEQGKRIVIRITGPTRESVQQAVIEKYGSAATFSKTEPASVKQTDPAVVARQAIKAERDAWAQAKSDEELIVEQTRLHREYCLTAPHDVIRELWDGNTILLQTESDVAGEFAGDRKDFLTWPWEENKPMNRNWQALVSALQQFGLPEHTSPTLLELTQAYKWCRDHNAFHQAKVYRRSDYHLKAQVQPVNLESVEAIQASARDRAIRKVNAFRLPAGFRVTADKAAQIGLTSEEFEALVATKQVEQERDWKDLRDEVQADTSRRTRTRAENTRVWGG